MNLWFRLIVMLVSSLFRPRVEPMGTATIRMTALPNDLDFNGHVNNGRYLTLADVARMDYVVRSGVGRLALKKRALPIVGDAIAKFRRDLRPFQRFDIQTRIVGWDDKWVFVEHRFVRDGRVLAVVAIRGLFKTAEGPLTPTAFTSDLGVDSESPVIPEWIREWSRSCDSMSRALRADEKVI